jgi:hypothetical protein
MDGFQVDQVIAYVNEQMAAARGKKFETEHLNHDRTLPEITTSATDQLSRAELLAQMGDPSERFSSWPSDQRTLLKVGPLTALHRWRPDCQFPTLMQAKALNACGTNSQLALSRFAAA